MGMETEDVWLVAKAVLAGLLCCIWLFVVRSRPTVYRPASRAKPAIECNVATAGEEGLKVLTVNAWSGSTYEFAECGSDCSTLQRMLEWVVGQGSVLELYPGENGAARFQALVEQVIDLGPAVIVLNEVYPCPSYARRLADKLGYDCLAAVAVTGIHLGPLLHFPPGFTEGDAILAHPRLQLNYLSRARLTGMVFSDYCSLNTGDATQALCGTFLVPAIDRRLAIVATHWQAGLLSDTATLDQLEELRKAHSAEQLGIGFRAVEQATERRVEEAGRTVRFAENCMRQPVPNASGSTVAGVVLAGDLNTTISTPEYRVLKQAGFASDLAIEPTWDPAGNPNVKLQIVAGVEGQSLRPAIVNELYSWFSAQPRKLDHILVKSGAEHNVSIQASSTVLAEASASGVVPSDHYGVLARVQIR